MTTISLLGLGAMGARMAERLGAAGHTLTIWNRTPERATEVADRTGAAVATNPAAAADGADVVISMVRDDEASRDVWLGPDGVVASLGPHSLAIESSTLSRRFVLELADAVRATGAGFVEAPVVGSRPQAEAGALFVLAGGPSDSIERARPVLEAYGAAVRHVGEVGDAAVMKLAINSLFAGQVALYAEVAGLLDRSTVPTGEALELLAELPITSPGLQRIVGLFRERRFEPNFPVALVAKDLAYAGRLGAGLDADLPVIDAVAEVFDAGAAGPQTDLDIAGIVDRYLD